VVIASGRSELEQRLDGVMAGGGTALYDAVAQSFEAGRARVKAAPDRISQLHGRVPARDRAAVPANGTAGMDRTGRRARRPQLRLRRYFPYPAA
jgi:hypothetical protein